VAAVRVLVIEDEAVIALDVAEHRAQRRHQVVGIAATEKTAVELSQAAFAATWFSQTSSCAAATAASQRQPDHAIDDRCR